MRYTCALRKACGITNLSYGYVAGPVGEVVKSESITEFVLPGQLLWWKTGSDGYEMTVVDTYVMT